MRVLVVDDSAFYRKLLREALSVLDVEVVGVAHHGKMALERIEELRPDLITLDLEMPELDGLGVLRELKRRNSPVGVIVCTALNAAAARTTVAALEGGAFDLLPKVQDGFAPAEAMQSLINELRPRIKAFEQSRAPLAAPTPVVAPPRRPAFPGASPEVVVLGVSTGGPSALARLLPRLPATFPAPILVVQHMPPLFTKSLADDLARSCPLKVSEAVNGDRPRPGTVLIAPGGKQMKIAIGSIGPVIHITDDPPERNCRPSVDYLFRSAADVYGGRTLAAILTGMGDDGTVGCRAIKSCGGTVLTQDAASCVVYGMPRSVAEAGLSDGAFDLEKLADELTRRVTKQSWAVA